MHRSLLAASFVAVLGVLLPRRTRKVSIVSNAADISPFSVTVLPAIQRRAVSLSPEGWRSKRHLENWSLPISPRTATPASAP